MSTKFILHGGFNKERGSVQEDDHFFKEMVKDLPDEAKVLLVYFAEREEKIPRCIIEDQEQFKKSNPVKTFKFRVATEENFIEDCAWADLIYLQGLGLIPYKIVAHYEKGTPNPLASIEPEIETMLLGEYETKCFLI